MPLWPQCENTPLIIALAKRVKTSLDEENSLQKNVTHLKILNEGLKLEFRQHKLTQKTDDLAELGEEVKILPDLISL